MKYFSIGKLSKIVDLSTKTIRFYEDKGLIRKAERQENGYRQYPGSAVDELKVIKYGRDLGLPIAEIQKLLHGCCRENECTHSAEYLKSYLKNYSALIDQRIQEMTSLKDKLSELDKNIAAHHCEDSETYCCNIFYQVISNMQRKGGEKNV